MKAWIALAGVLVGLVGCGAADQSAGAVPISQPGARALAPLAPPSPGTPIGRSDAAVAYDPETGQTVLFGGLAANGALGDTWVWNGGQWLEQHPALSPHSRTSASMTYDPALHALVLFGGDADAPIGPRERADMAATWSWTGTGWLRHGETPFPLGSGPVAYDAVSRRIVMVVRRDAPHLIACSAATWTFDGDNWHEEAPATPLPGPFVTVVPEPATGHLLAIVAPRAAVAPAGLASTDCPVGSAAAKALPQATTWRWSGSTWSQVGSGTEPVVATSAPELDPVAGASEVIRPSDETVWTWSGSGWRAAASAGPAPPSRTGSQVSLDRRGHVVLFSGYGDTPTGAYRYDTWTWNGSAWTDATGSAPPTPSPSPSAFTPPAN